MDLDKWIISNERDKNVIDVIHSRVGTQRTYGIIPGDVRNTTYNLQRALDYIVNNASMSDDLEIRFSGQVFILT